MDGAKRKDWRKACRKVYQRNGREYVEPEGSLILVSHAEADDAPIYDPESGGVGDVTWTAVRGTDYVPAATWDLADGEAHAITVDLVPTPDNPHDPTAVAVEYQGIKLGNLGRGYAAYAHWKFRQLNYRGLRVRTAAAYRAFYRPEIRCATPEAFVALPSLAALDRHTPSMEEQISAFRRLWEALSPALQDEIRSDWYHLTDASTAKLLQYADLFPELTLPSHESSSMPKAFDLAMQAVRLEEKVARQAEREAAEAAERDAIRELVAQRLTRGEIAERLELPRGRVDRIVKELGLAAEVEVRQASQISDARKQEVLQRAKSGQSNTQIEREMKLGKGRAAKILAEKGIYRSAPSGGLTDVHLATMRRRLHTAYEALALQQAGHTRAEISARLGVSSSTVKNYLADARFFAAPDANPERLARAVDARRRQLTRGRAGSGSERHAISDANILNLAQPGWMGAASEAS